MTHLKTLNVLLDTTVFDAANYSYDTYMIDDSRDFGIVTPTTSS